MVNMKHALPFTNRSMKNRKMGGGGGYIYKYLGGNDEGERDYESIDGSGR